MSLQQIDQIISILNKQSKPYDWVVEEFSKIQELKNFDLDLETFELLGLGLTLNKDNTFTLKTRTKKIKEEIFCVVDIESTGGVNKGEILEIGAVKIQNSKQIGVFQSFIKVKAIPENISELTGITYDMVKNAPSLAKVLNDFRLFLKDSIFVAHNVRFDYSFISKVLDECDFGILLNRRICTIEFAQCCIQSPKYKLEVLKEFLGIENVHHRALDDALAAAEILKYCLSKLPYHIKTTEELIHFIKTTRLKTK
ncbi:3'-5' exonuclease [Campylobacter hepaticus]|uniref:3'-5' exonuclease n=1 Tax=Campylobacter hepaticus TaxID=1813019 RepID=A0A424YZL3_9BACT|nr:3'-5' exonuclease [Campylobacter hepaticus]AXP08183.1 3'-5' exonuclease [Campylobacter hepaticus]MCZ0772721.1 3'-5' exonuclease [Campylobacter hepaticus]MCZ0774189.1 3'-5' exonuclease [Campylobacter hepaticus]MCZ0775441.1 3'-5' exonuclease [Campylobacter hepaticus]MDX2323801.1 3'-5' exonuclease [Campylobacter hepaticus]